MIAIRVAPDFEIVTLPRLFVYVLLSSQQSPTLSAEQNALVLVMPGGERGRGRALTRERKKKKKDPKCQGDRLLIYSKSNFFATS